MGSGSKLADLQENGRNRPEARAADLHKGDVGLPVFSPVGGRILMQT